MSFNENASIDTSQVSSGGGGGRPGGMVVGGGIGGLIITIILALLGINPGDVTGGGGTSDQGYPQDTSQVDNRGGSSDEFAHCKTGADANRDDNCRAIMTVNSVQDFWTKEFQRHGKEYQPATMVLYSGATQSACGTASNQVGPFYCPTDAKVYLDTSFYEELNSRFGGSTGPLAQEYVIAHEYGHHVQDLLGVLGRAQQDPQGAQSGAVRIELMADCLGGVWAKHAVETKDAQGNALMKPFTQQDLQDAVSAAKAVGDDNIQERAQGRVTPESWTHGSSKARATWFATGYKSGDLNQCDTFAVDKVE